MAHGVGMAEGDVGRVVRAETRAAHSDALTRAFAARQIEHVTHDHVFVSIVRAHPVRGMDRFVVETLKVDGIRAINRDSTGVDVASNRTD